MAGKSISVFAGFDLGHGRVIPPADGTGLFRALRLELALLLVFDHLGVKFTGAHEMDGL